MKYDVAGPGELRPNSLLYAAETLTNVRFTDSFVSVSVWPALCVISVAGPSVNASAVEPPCHVASSAAPSSSSAATASAAIPALLDRRVRGMDPPANRGVVVSACSDVLGERQAGTSQPTPC